MKQKLLKLLYNLVGDPHENSLEHRLFNSIALVNGISNLFGSFQTFFLPNFLYLFILNFGIGILFLVFYYFSRFKSIYYILFWPLNLTMIIFLSINWFLNGGSLGGSHYYLIPALVIANILLRKQNIYFLYLIYILTLSSLFIIEYQYPDLIQMFTTKEERFFDSGLNYIFVMILTGILIFILSKNLDLERKKSDRLLLNILPESIAEELKKKDFVEPKYYPSVTVLFTDMAGFTKIAESMKPSQLIQELDSIFSEFDRIAKKYNVEKIKTIGDAYMCAGGLPIENNSHPFDVVKAAIEFKEYMLDLKNAQIKKQVPYFELRIGIHTGPIIAGVIGKEKFAYDIWGDTVNTASRMESSGVVGEINLSSSTYELIKEFYTFESRGKISVKGKGEIDMYLLKDSINLDLKKSL